MATTYAYLVDPNKQYMTKSGTINVNGTLRVYDAATDDIVITYKDFNGTENEASIKLDNNGRAIVITDSARAYRLEVYDRYGSLQWTVSPLWCLAAGGGVNVHTTRVISTDGSIDVDQIDVGSTTTYDIGLAPSDSMEYLEWVKCNDENISNGTWYPTYAEGTMETSAGEGLQVGESRFYHITSTLKVDPTGNGINYETLSVSLIFNDGDEEHELIRRDFDIDNSVNDPTLCEFSYDFACQGDGFIYIKVDGVNHFTQVDSELQVHRIYSGINAVPGSCAAKPWVSEYFEEKSSMSAYIPYSGLDYNQGGAITGISGSAIYAALDSSTVSAIASSYAESAISSISGWSGDFSSISSKIDWSSSGVFQPSGDYQTAGDYAYNSAVSSKVDQSAFEQCCDEVHSALDEKLDKSASSEFQPSGQYVYESAYSSFSSEVTNNISSISSTVSGVSADMSSYVPFSGIEGEGGHVTGISGSSIKGHEYTGLNPIVVDNTADTIAVEHRTLCVDSTMTAYNSGSSAVIGVNVAGLDISSKMDASASSLFYSTSNPSGFIDGASASAIASAYAESAASGKLDSSASSSFYTTANESGYVDSAYVESQVSGKEDKLTFGYDDSAISSINGSALAGGGGAQVVTSLQYATSESATVDSTVTADTDVGYGARDISAAYYDYGYGSWIHYDSSKPLVQVRMTAEGNMANYSSNPYYLYVVPYGATNYGSVSTTSELTGALSFGEFSRGMNDLIVAEGTGSASQDPYCVEVTFNVTHVPFIGSEPAYWGTVEGSYDAVDNNEYTRPVFCVAGGYDGSQLFELRNRITAELDFGSIVTVSAVSGINELDIYTTGGGGADTSAVSAIASAYANRAVSGVSSTVYGNSARWDNAVQYSAFTGVNGLVTGVVSGLGWASSVSGLMGVGSAIKESTGVIDTAQDPAVVTADFGYGGSITFSGTADDPTRIEYINTAGSLNNAIVYRDSIDIARDVSGVITASSLLGYGYDFGVTYTALSPEALAFQSDLTGAGVDSAAVSAIASAYAESAVSSKADSSALSSYVPYSSLEYNTASAISGINGSALAAGSTYSAGEGIDITDDVISVETPVDIVAGPGIVIDNPDGNTLRVSVAQDMETVLWEGASTVANALKNGAGLTLSESPFNFEYIEVHWVPWAYSDPGTMKQEAVAKAFVTSARPRIGMVNEWTDEGNNAVFLFTVNAYFTDSKFYTTNIKYFMIGDWNVTSTGNGTYITKIVGIHRINGGN